MDNSNEKVGAEGQRNGLLRAKVLPALALSLAAFVTAPVVAQTTVVDGTLTVGSDITYPPYVYFEDKQPAGFDADFSTLMADKLGLELNIIDTRFADLVLGLRANRFDMVASALYVTPERAKQIDYVPYLKTGSSIIAMKDSVHTPATPQDLCGLKVSNIRAASWRPKVLEVAESYCKAEGKPGVEMLEYPTSPEAFLALRSGAVDVMMEDAAVAHQMASSMDGAIKVTSTELIFPIVIGLGVSKNNSELRDALSAALDEARASGEYQALLEKYGLAAPSEAEIAESLQAEG